MFAWLISGGIAGLLKPFLALGDKWLSNQADKERLKAGTDRVVYETDAAVRKVKLGYLLLRLPLFIAETTAALYFAAVLTDSLFPSDWLNPLKLPADFQPHFGLALASIFGLATFERIMRK